MKFAKIFLVMGILALFSGCSFNLKNATSSNNATTNNLASQDSKPVNSKTQEHLIKAKAEATIWKSDAAFSAFNFKAPLDLNPKNLTETYVFSSNSDPENWWTYSIDQQDKVVRALIPKEDYLGSALQSINEVYWKKNYAEALKTADSNGGSAFREKHPETEITLTLSQSEPKNWLWYVVEYRSSSNDNQKIRISANDGKVYDDQGKPK